MEGQKSTYWALGVTPVTLVINKEFPVVLIKKLKEKWAFTRIIVHL